MFVEAEHGVYPDGDDWFQDSGLTCDGAGCTAEFVPTGTWVGGGSLWTSGVAWDAGPEERRKEAASHGWGTRLTANGELEDLCPACLAQERAANAPA
jgi:hypothetical protein